MQANDATISAYSLNHFCRSFDIGRSRAYLEIASGRLRVRKVGRRTLVLKADAEAWANSLPEGRFQRN